MKFFIAGLLAAIVGVLVYHAEGANPPARAARPTTASTASVSAKDSVPPFPDGWHKPVPTGYIRGSGMASRYACPSYEIEKVNIILSRELDRLLAPGSLWPEEQLRNWRAWRDGMLASYSCVQVSEYLDLPIYK